MAKVKLLHTSNRKQWVAILAVLAVSVFTVNLNYNAKHLMTSVTSYNAEPFDGTVMPIQKVPSWSNLTSAEYNYSYSELPSSKLIPIPEYRNDYLTIDTDTLGWSTSDKLIRDTQITYPVPFSGNYELNHCGEGCGSHPAVDIKTPEGTPVYSIANGVVDDAGTSGSWGNYIVVRHEGVPNPASPSQTTTLYSSYSHLLELYVADGDVLTKGEVIGQVGDTGTATTYHLHFQIDNASAPWHPYWPFTTAEASAAGYDFWDAVNHGVGQDNLYAYTVNPLDFVQDYLDESAVLDPSSDGNSEEDNADEDLEEQEENSVDSVTEEDSSVVTIDFDSLNIELPYFVQPGQNPEVVFQLLDGNGNVYEDASFDGEMSVVVSDESVGKLNRSSLSEADFDDGEARLNFYADHAGEVTITVSISGRVYVSSSLFVIDSIEPFAQFGVAHDGSFVLGKEETIQIQAQDLEGRPTPGFYGDGSVELEIIQGSGTLEPSTLSKKDFPTGIAEVSFIGDSEEAVIIQVTYGTKETQSTALVSQLFNDFDSSYDYYDAVSYLYRQGTVQGYPDGTFQPERIVSRVESLKFIFAGLDQSLTSGLTANYTDTRSDEWYSSYLSNASSRGIVQGYSDGSFRPGQGVNRVEFLKILFSTVDVSVDPVVTEDPYDDVNALSWYAPYVQYAKEKNIFPISGSVFNPAEPMSRLEVAEVIYRMITVLDNDEEEYSALHRPSDY